MSAPDEPPAKPPPSFGNMGEHHWSKARAGTNEEALDYYRQRSHAPGVAEGGSSRNHYCMQCDGVIPFEHAEPNCPHCGAEITGEARRYFNWVELNEPPRSDLRSLLPLFIGAGLALAAVVVVVVYFVTRAEAAGT